MKFLVLGHLSIDVCHQSDGSAEESYGGMVNVVQALSELAEKGDRIIPVSGVHPDDMPAVATLMRSLPGVDVSGLFPQRTPTHRVQFFPRDDGQTIACTKEPAAPIPFEQISDFLDVDGILLNMFSGFDITLETLDAMRIAIRPREIPIHLDYHNLTQGLTEQGERIRRPLVAWRRWAFMMDTVQLNEEELQGLTRERMSEEQLAGHLFTLGVKGVLVTRGRRGARLYRSERKHVLYDDVVAEGGGSDDRVGTGDLFGAAFHFRHVKSPDLTAAMRFAQSFVSARELTPKPLTAI